MMNDASYIQAFESPDWGNYYQPVHKREARGNPLRIVLFGSTLGGMWVLEAFKRLQQQYGANNIELIGLVTDDARIPNARISVKKRIWRYFPLETRVKMVNGIIETALAESMEVFTGNVKSEFFGELIRRWNPDLILMACFGQLVPPSVFTYPKFGMYNFHPSDLKKGIGIGPKPFENTLENQMSHTCVSVMEVTNLIDQGPMVACSPLICITGPDGELFDNVLLTEEKVTSVFPYLAEALIRNIWSLRTNEKSTKLTQLNMEAEIDSAVQKRLLEAVSGVHGKHYPFPEPVVFDFPYPQIHPIQA
ncbi:MAG: formyltransferase family protein [Bacteroidota bacterium]